MFIENDELKTAIYRYQLDEITEADDDIIYMAIQAATDEAKSYLRPGGKKDFMDGRPLYDVDLIFNPANPNQRNALLLEVTKNIAVWYLIRLCNVDMIFDNVKDRYDRAITWLKQVNKGDVILNLPLIANTDLLTSLDKQPFRFGSREKFIHE